LSENTGTVAITGSSGFIGSELAGLLRSEGLAVLGISRHPRAGELGWDPYAGRIDAAGLTRVETVIHLAGAGVAEERWTPERKAEIRRSRVEVTQFLSRALANLDSPPTTLLSGSAIGFYGSRGDEELTESSPPGEGFFADLCRDWEAATAPAQAAGIRVAHLRTGIVLGEGGGALKKMLPPFRAGLGGHFGSGKQWMSWIALPDILRAITFLMEHPQIAGPVNLVGPNPATNAEFTRTLNHALHRPGFLPVPEAAVRLLFGEMGEATLLGSQRVLPARLQSAGFQFRHGVLAEALPGLLRR
jgi:uncharacterized protein (TIGR01777 family)